MHIHAMKSMWCPQIALGRVMGWLGRDFRALTLRPRHDSSQLSVVLLSRTSQLNTAGNFVAVKRNGEFRGSD